MPRDINNSVKIKLWQSLGIYACAYYLLIGFAAQAAPPAPAPLRTNEPIYQNPFDIAAGGASLTRATQDGVVFANPSLPAFGGGLLRSIFLRTGLHVGAQATDLAYGLVKGGAKKLDSSLIDKALKTPVFMGLDATAGFITKFGGGGFFSSTKVDASARQFGSMGLPELRVRAQSYAGAISTASMVVGDWLALGVAERYQANCEIYKSIGILEVQNSKQFVTDAKKSLNYGLGLGSDIGATLQRRTRHVDVRFATTINDIGNTKFSRNMGTWKETLNVGTGITFHNRKDALHCAVDVRDVFQKYGEHWTRRSYTGCKGMFGTRMGAAAGLYQGWPTAGVVLNLMFFRLEAGFYSKEMGKSAGSEGRKIYFVALGAEIP